MAWNIRRNAIALVCRIKRSSAGRGSARVCHSRTRSNSWLAACLGATALALAGVGQPACAGGLVYELKAGVLAHDVPDLWSGFQAERSAADINLEAVLTPSVTVFGGQIRPAIGATINYNGDTSHAYVDARWQWETALNVFFAIGVGAAVHDGETGPSGGPNHKWLGSRLLFHVPIEIGYHLDRHNSLSVYFEHTSNAYTQTYNEGLDRIGIRYGYRF